MSKEQEIYAYRLDTYNIVDCYELQEDVIVFDNSRKGYEKRVKQKIWNIVEEMELRHDWDRRDITFDDIHYHRAPEYDKRMYKGEYIDRWKYKHILSNIRLNKYLQSILDDVNITHCHIMKRGEYYRDECAGYTSVYDFAGIYTKEYAVEYGRGMSEIHISPINNDKHNKRLNETIELIKSHLTT